MGRTRLGGDRRATGGVTPPPRDPITKGPAHPARGPFRRSVPPPIAVAPTIPSGGNPSIAGRMRRPGRVPAAVDQKRLRSFIVTVCVSLEAPKVFWYSMPTR